MPTDPTDALRAALKRVAVALKETGVPFALTGGYAAWSRGSPESLHDVDFLVRPEDAAGVAQELERRGFAVEQPPEDWLFKVHLEEAVVDVLHRATRTTVAEVLDRAEVLPVLSVRMPVVSTTDVVTQKLLAMDEHYCDLAAVLPTLRALREQVEWDAVRRDAEGHPFAETAIFLLERLGVVAPVGSAREGLGTEPGPPTTRPPGAP